MNKYLSADPPSPSSAEPTHQEALTSSATPSSSVRIIDGDTIAIGTERIRIFGIDAPENDQSCEIDRDMRPCGQLASRELARLIGRESPDCRVQGRDRYGRAVAICRVGGRDLGSQMVASGWAVAFERYSKDYVEDETAARAGHRGMWQGQFERPETWRAQRRSKHGLGEHHGG